MYNVLFLKLNVELWLQLLVKDDMILYVNNQ